MFFKKLTVLLAVVAVAALAAPALSATNPFMDVPMNHWAYDAIGQLAANNVISGFPDGTFKGQQATTRYEMASGLARSLAIVDWTKASKQDVEMLKRLVVEFKDELESLGVRVDELDERVAVYENRLGGWHIHGTLVLDVKYQKGNDTPGGGSLSEVGFDEARLNFKRTWGDNDEYFFHARLRNEGDTGNANKNDQSAFMDRFYFQMPFLFDTRMTIGRYLWDDEAGYRMSLPQTGSWTGDSVLTDWTSTVFMVNKNFALGNAKLGIAHPDKDPLKKEGGDWMVYAAASVQFTEQIGIDLGGQLFYGDNAEQYARDDDGNFKFKDAKNEPQHGEGDVSFNNLWTVFAGLHFDFNDKVGVKGMFYHQKADTESVQNNKWEKYGYGFQEMKGNGQRAGDYIEDANHWKGIIDVKQEALRFTSLWLEYGQFDQGFWAPEGQDAIMTSNSPIFKDFFHSGSAYFNIKYFRIALGQQWTDKWATHLFYNNYTVENGKAKSNGGRDDAKPKEYGLGVQYKANDATTFGLNYLHAENDLDGDNTDDNVIRFRTAVSF